MFGAIPAFVATMAMTIATIFQVSAQESVTNAAGRTFEGRITGVQNGAIQVAGASGTIGVPLSQVRSVQMRTPEDHGKALASFKAGKTAEALVLIAPVAAKFGGLPTPWARESTRMAAELNIIEGDLAAAEAALAKYEQLYPGDPSAQIGRARIAVAKNELDRARELLKPILAQAETKPETTGAPGVLFSQAYLVKGLINEADGAESEALQDYLTTVAIFAGDAPSVAAARARADAITAKGNVFVP